MGCLFSTVNYRIFPVFRPNEYFWKNHHKEGEERWQTYARAIREIIHEGGDIPYCKTNIACEDKWALASEFFPSYYKKEKDAKDAKKKN